MTGVQTCALPIYDDVEYPVEGESLVARRALSAQVKEDDMEQ